MWFHNFWYRRTVTLSCLINGNHLYTVLLLMVSAASSKWIVTVFLTVLFIMEWFILKCPGCGYYSILVWVKEQVRSTMHVSVFSKSFSPAKSMNYSKLNNMCVLAWSVHWYISEVDWLLTLIDVLLMLLEDIPFIKLHYMQCICRGGSIIGVWTGNSKAHL